MIEPPEREARGNICGCISARYVLAVLGSIAMGITYALKVNLTITMVGMLNHTAIKALTSSGAGNDTSHNVDEDGPFVWVESLQGIILSSYFWGYLVFQTPGARIAEVFSAKWTMFGSVVVNVVCTVLTPIMAKFHYSALVVMRVLEGLGGATTFPAMHVLLAHWAPPLERSTMSSIVYAGTCLGTVVSILAAGVIAGTLGWEAVFYIMGGVSVPWCGLWVWMVQDTPAKQKYMTVEEREFLKESLGQGHAVQPPVPWRAVFTSLPFWAILIAHVCSNWGWYMVLIEIPFYMTQVLKFNIKENAVLSALPYLFMWLFSIMLSRTLDWMITKRIISTTTSRKLATAIASVIPGSVLFSLCYIGNRRWLAVALMNIAVTSIGGMFSGFLSNHIDIAPNFAGTLIALTNTIATVPGIVVPNFVGYLTHGNQTIGAWSIVFYSTVALYIVEVIVYVIFGSGVEQQWNKFEPEPEKNKQ